MKRVIMLKNIFPILVIFSSILFYNCTTDQNITGLTEIEYPVVFKINTNDYVTEEISLDSEEGVIIDIQVAPNILNLQNNGVVVTIHTDIPYS